MTAGRTRLPSYLAATFSRYQRKIVAGVSAMPPPLVAFGPAVYPFGEETTLRVCEAQPLRAEAAAKHSVLRS
jgi:hypothetical protein